MHCKFCEKHCKNNNSLRNHERLCKDNPDRQLTIFSDGKFISTHKRSNAAIKAKENGSVYVVSDETRRKLSFAIKQRSQEFNKINGIKISDTINKKVVEGTWHTSLAKRMHIIYNGVDLHGTWEYKYAVYLDANNIKWIRNTKTFPYVYEGILRNYTPDFYLPNSNEYVEIKGYKTEKDSEKWKQFPKDERLVIMLKDDLKSLNII